MTPILSPLSVIRFSLAFWEVIEYSGTGIVIVGAIDEYIAEFKKLPGDEHKRERFRKIRAIVLVAGLAVELAGVPNYGSFISSGMARARPNANSTSQ
jgi:hypothetical protein